MTELEDKVRKEEYERLKEIVGKEKADKYFEELNYPVRAIGLAILSKQLKDFYYRYPILSKILLVICIVLLIYYVLKDFYYWI